MADFNGRRAPNFSQYLNELNTLPSHFEQTAQPDELFNVEEELALFTNAEFLDFDPAGNVGMDEQQPVSGTVSPANGRQDMNYVGMLNDFNLPNFPYYQPQPQMVPVQPTAYPPTQPLPSNNSLPQTAPPQQQQQQQQQQHLQQQSQLQAQQPTATSTQSPPAAVSSKRKSDVSSASDIEKANRLAQEEDKRRRNTAASARFRIKKKEREKNLEKTVKEVTSKNSTLESRVSQLEMENRWLRNLIVEKNGSALTEGDLSGMFHKYQEATGQHQNQNQNQRQVSTSPGSELKSSP